MRILTLSSKFCFNTTFPPFSLFTLENGKKILSLFKIAKLRSSGRTRDFYFPCTNSIIAISAILKHIIIHLSYLDLLKLFTSILKMRNCWTTFYNCKSCSSKMFCPDDNEQRYITLQYSPQGSFLLPRRLVCNVPYLTFFAVLKAVFQNENCNTTQRTHFQV